MTRDEANKALDEARRNQPELRQFVYGPAAWDARRAYLWDALTGRGEGLAGMWTSLADDVFELVAYGVLTKQNWRTYFNANRPEIRSGGDPEAASRSRDPDQINTCLNGLARLIAIIPDG